MVSTDGFYTFLAVQSQNITGQICFLGIINRMIKQGMAVLNSPSAAVRSVHTVIAIVFITAVIGASIVVTSVIGAAVIITSIVIAAVIITSIVVTSVIGASIIITV